jgi:SAM-dependent methyltransferase
MDTLQAWLADNTERRRVLDLGCGEGSFDYQFFGCSGVIGIDSIAANLKPVGRVLPVIADAAFLPLPSGTFDLVISHHSLEHFRNARAVVREIGRILKPTGRLFVSVPDGGSLSDRLYRFLLAGGGHFQLFTFTSLVNLIESETSLHLVSWQTLYSSFQLPRSEELSSIARRSSSGAFPSPDALAGSLTFERVFNLTVRPECIYTLS